MQGAQDAPVIPEPGRESKQDFHVENWISFCLDLCFGWVVFQQILCFDLLLTGAT